MVETEVMEQEAQLPLGIGERLRAAREAKGLSIAQLSDETRITRRHLEFIEKGEFGGLPGRTYAIGFARNYAKVVGLPPEDVARDVREELAGSDTYGDRHANTFEPGDPARVPSRRLAWLSALAALVLFAGGAAFLWRTYISPADSLPSLLAPDDSAGEPALQAAGPATRAATVQSPLAAAPGGTVVFTALEEGVWVKFYDKDGKQLMQKQMAIGENYTVPADAQGPQLWTGRPDALAISVGGRNIPKLSNDDIVMRDVPVTAQALLARPPAPPVTAPSPTA